MTRSILNRFEDSHTSLVNGSAPRLTAQTHAEERVIVKRSAIDIEREVIARERRRLIVRIATSR